MGEGVRYVWSMRVCVGVWTCDMWCKDRCGEVCGSVRVRPPENQCS